MSLTELALRSIVLSLLVLAVCACPFFRTRRDILLVSGALLLVALPTLSCLPQIHISLPNLPSARPTESDPSTIFSLLKFVWLIGSLLVAIRWLANTYFLKQSLRHGTPPPNEPIPLLAASIAREIGLPTTPRIEIHSSLSTPAVSGLFRPRLLLPVDAVHWSNSRLRAVFLHEFAHLLRHDLWREVAFRITEILYWWNPLVWNLGKLHREEREQHCDAQVLQSGFPPTDYARSLLDLATRPTQLSPVAMAAGSSLEKRIAALFQKQPEHPKKIAASIALGLIIVPLFLALILISLQQPDSVSMEQEIDLRLSANPFPGFEAD